MAQSIRIIIILNAVFIGIFFINALVFNSAFNSWGIYPRHIEGLRGVIFSPFLHGSIMHLISNIIGFSIFAFFAMLQGKSYFFRASIFIICAGGLGVWLFGRSNIHIGASGWIFGLWALNIANAWYQRSIKNIAIGAFVAFVWGGMIFGVLPTRPYISFEGHLFGALAGIVFSKFFRIKG